MKQIIKNTEATVEEVRKWRDNDWPPEQAKYNAKVSVLLDELNNLSQRRVNDIDDVNMKIQDLIAILVRGIEFKEY